MSQSIIDLIFPVKGTSLPWDHSYPLFGALSRKQSAFHAEDYPLGVFPINGLAEGGGRLKLTDKSALRLRVPSERIGDVLPLVGSEIELDGHTARLGNPSLEPVRFAARLFSPWVTYSKVTSESEFLSRIQQDLDRLQITARYGLVQPLHQQSKDGGQGSRSTTVRRTRKIKDNSIIGFAVLLEDLNQEHSRILCRDGLGGRRHFGGGLFLPARNRP